MVDGLFESEPSAAAPAAPRETNPAPIQIDGQSVTSSPLVRGLKETAIAGPVAPGFGELQAAPGRALLTVQDQFSNDPLYKMAGPVSINPFATETRDTIKNIGPELLKAFLGFTDPGVNIAKKALGPAADLPAFIKTQAAGPIGSVHDILDKAGITKSNYSTMKLGESPVTTLLGQQLDVMASPNVYNLITWPLKVRYKLASEIFNEIGARVKNAKGKVVVDEGEFMRWAESKSPNALNQILKNIRAGKYDKRGAVPTERGVTVPGSPDLNPQGSAPNRPAPGTPAPTQPPASPLVVENLFDAHGKAVGAAARTAGSFFKSSRAFPGGDPALLQQLDELEAQLDATKNIRARKKLLDESEELFAKLRQQELSKTQAPTPEPVIETSPKIRALQDEALAKRREKAVKDLVQDWLRYSDASDVMGAENAVFGEGAIKDYPGLKELTTDEKNDLARYLNRIRGSIDAANSPETAAAYEKQVQKTSDEAVTQILGERAKLPAETTESLPAAAPKAESQVVRAKPKENQESAERAKLEAWIRKRAKEYESKSPAGGFGSALKRVSEELRGERGQAPKDILALAQYHLRSTLDQETGEVLSAASPDWPRTGTLYDFLDEQGNKDPLYDENDAGSDFLRAKPKAEPVKKARVAFELPRQVTDQEAREVFFFDDGDTVESAILKGLRDEINQGEAGGRIYDEELGRYTGGYPSTFPDYFKNKGYSKAETLRIISLALDKQPMTERQKNILTDLVDGYIEQSQKRAEYHADQEEAESQSLEGKGAETDVSAQELQKQDQDPSQPSRPQVLEPEQRYETKPSADPFYSFLEETVKEKMPNSAPVAQVKGLLTSAGVKQEEMDWLDIEGFLAGKDKVTRQDLLDYVHQNQVQIKEVKKGGPPKNVESRMMEIEDAFRERGFTIQQDDYDPELVTTLDKDGEFVELDEIPEDLWPLGQEYESLHVKYRFSPQDTKFSQYTLPGGDNYREVLLTLPEKKSGIDPNAPGSAIAQRDFDSKNNQFRSSHWDEPNVLAHLRLNDRQTDLGKTLFIEEIQSDWHQKGRKEGYKKPLKKPSEYVLNENQREWGRLEQIRRVMSLSDSQNRRYRELGNALTAEERSVAISGTIPESQVRAFEEQRAGVPDAPFKKTWHELALKKILRMAAEEGYDAIAWTTGAQQADRYDLSKQISRIDLQTTGTGAGIPKDGPFERGSLIAYDKNGNKVISEYISDPKRIADIVGKEAADKILNAPNVESRVAGLGSRVRTLTGQDLKVGGEGMKGFYDQILPSFLNKYTKKWGGKVQESSIETGFGNDLFFEKVGDRWEVMDRRQDNRTIGDYASRQEAEEGMTRLEKSGKKETVHALEITPDMRNSVLSGQRLFEPGSQYDLPGMDKRGELKLEEEIAYGKKGGRKEAIDKISRDEREVTVSAPDGVTPVWKSALALKLKETGTLKFPAQKIKGPEDIAFAFKAMKNEAQEHFYVGAIKDGEIVGVELVSIGSINSALAPLMETLPVLQSHMADSFFLVHNHPSGRLDPSKEDLQLTRAAVKSLGDAGFDFKGHVIINDTKFGFIDPDLGYTVQPHKEYSKTKDVSVFRKRNEWLKSKDSRAKITAPEDVYEIIKGVTLDDAQGLVAVLDSSHFVQSLSMIPQSSFDFPFLSKLASAHRGPKLIFSNSGLSPAQITRLSRDLDALNISILDSVDPISPTEFSSARTSGLIGEKGQDYAAAQRLGEKKLDSYGNEEIPEIPDDASAAAKNKKRELILNTFNAFQFQMDFWDQLPPSNPKVLTGPLDPRFLKDVTNIQAGWMDIYRQFENVFGEYYPEIKAAILDRLDESRDDFIQTQKQWIEALDKEVVRALGIKKGSKESEAVQMYGEGQINDVELKAWFGEEKMEKIIAADRWFREAYNQLIAEVNRTRARIFPGKPEKLVPMRPFYYRHFRDLASDSKLGFGGLANIFDTSAQISSKLAGLSPYTKPKSKWASFMQSRMGKKTEVDAVGGFLDYIPAATYAIHIDPNIPRFRTLAKELREITEDQPVVNRFIESLEDFAGDLAGKTNPLFDRDFIKFFNLGPVDGRKLMRVANWINSRVKRNSVLMNASSLVAQLFNIPVAAATAKQYMLLGIANTMAQTVRPSADMAKSKFLAARFAGNMYDRFDMDMVKKTMKTSLAFAGWAMGAMDEIATRTIWNAFYEQAKAKKLSNPIGYADTKTRESVAGRSIGEVPLAQKSKIIQLLAPFQLEVANAWWVLGDRFKKKDFAGLVAFALTVYMMNTMSEKSIGRRYAFDPINAALDAFTGEKTLPQRFGRIAGEVLSNFPMGQTLAAVYPEFGFTIGDRKFPTRKQLFGQADPTRFGGGLLVASGFRDPLFKLLPPFGGSAIKRGIEGYASAARGFVKIGKKEIPVESSKFNKFKGLLFGPYALPEMTEYFDFSEQVSQQKYMAKQV